MPAERTYAATVNDVISRVREVINDKEIAYRNGDNEILLWINDAINSVLVNIPALFAKIGQHACSQGVLQEVRLSRAHLVLDIIGVPVADIAALSRFMPGWSSMAAGPIQNWAAIPNSPLAFYCYPPSSDAQIIPILYAESPAPITSIAAVIPLPETYVPALVDYCVGMCESKDDESVNSNRASQFMADFVARVRGT
jgi:hypothetical protein